MTARDELIETVRESYGRRITPIDGYRYLIGSVGGCGVFLMPPESPDMTWEAYEDSLDETSAAGLNDDRLLMHCRRSLVGSDDIVHIQIRYRDGEAA
ncbi:hypothetical protein [Mycolicibacterium mageritense]|uniref:hypothetical protein n=1 Tax=Mycolicibacterium mageritense TaxID=53462 RepID=UPI0011D7C4D7|nr:hypothetical protein [Mycolicibacterium mageritense]TXI62481.1 MAG: hypothetical protein E6Q55_12725 [Mycolicibacterium mageritense]